MEVLLAGVNQKKVKALLVRGAGRFIL